MKEKKLQPEDTLQEEKKPAADESVPNNEGAEAASELEELRRKNEELERELAERKALGGRLESEISEFSEMFPEVALAEIPECVWAEVKSGLPLSASYARHEKKRLLSEEHAALVNRTAKEISSGSVSGTAEHYYTADEVRKMSASEVKKNYSKIISSMKHWN